MSEPPPICRVNALFYPENLILHFAMRGKKRFPPDKDSHCDEIAPETPLDDQEDPPSKRKRTDLSKRKKANKAIDFFVLKQTLKVFCKEEAKALAWDESLTAVNQAVAEAYLFANFYVLRQLEANRPICELGHGFYQTYLSIVTNPTRTAQSLREKYDSAVLVQARKDRSQRWREGDKVGKMKDTPIIIPEFSEAAYHDWLASLQVDVDLETAGHEFNKLRNGRPMANTEHLNQGWFRAAAKQMATNAQNAVVRNFAKRLRTYVIDFYGVEAKMAHAVLNGVFAQTFESIPVRVSDPIIVELREMIPRTSAKKISWAPHDLLPAFHVFLQFIEKTNEKNKTNSKCVEKRTFSLLPTKRGFESSYCKVDSTGLRALLLRSPLVDRDLTVMHQAELWTLGSSLKADPTTWIAMADLWWRRLFHVDTMEREGVRKFHREITTDGYGVGVHMSRPTRGKKEKKKGKDGKTEKAKDANVSDALGFPLPKSPKGCVEDYDVIWGIDPGRTDFITATSQEGKSVRFCTSDFRRASGFSRSNRKSKRRIDRSPRVRRLLQMTPTKKTSSLKALSLAIEFMFEFGCELLAFFMDPFFRKLKFRRYTLRNAQLDRACFGLAGTPGTKTIIGFGDCGAAGEGAIKHSPAGPVKSLARKLARYCEVVVVDEFRTSRVHHDCPVTEDLVNQRVRRVCRDGVERSVPVHKVLHCLTKNGGCGTTVDWDVNAAKNILSVLLNQLAGVPERPRRLQRATKTNPTKLQPIHRVVPFLWSRLL
ncbi:hypothetical protein BBJ28_00020519 [Nothophytophthora sp. Chile5]|nr:hypothetical protein BBJ28_00020519 [Nothophytophthora sp. Chile5]